MDQRPHGMMNFSVVIPAPRMAGVSAYEYHQRVVRHIPAAFSHEGCFFTTSVASAGDHDTVTVAGRTDNLAFIRALIRFGVGDEEGS